MLSTDATTTITARREQLRALFLAVAHIPDIFKHDDTCVTVDVDPKTGELIDYWEQKPLTDEQFVGYPATIAKIEATVRRRALQHLGGGREVSPETALEMLHERYKRDKALIKQLYAEPA